MVITNTSYTITVSVTPQITAVALDNTTISGIGSIPAGTVVGHVSFAPSGVGTPNPVTLSGPGATKFALTNGGVVPCDLVTAVAITQSESDDITLSVAA